MTTRRAVLQGLGGVLAGWGLSGVHAAEKGYPARPIHCQIGFPAGGATDSMMRIVGEVLSASLGQPVIVENRTGAAGTIATGRVARAKPDGYTLGGIEASALTISPALYDSLTYVPEQDFVFIGGVARIPCLLVVHPSLKVDDVHEFIELARSEPALIRYGSGGVGSPLHLPMELLQLRTGIVMQHIPYAGSAPALVDLVAGRIEAALLDVSTVHQYVQSGQIVALGMATAHRNVRLPDLPTFGEQGIDDFEVDPWVGLVAPAGISGEIQALLEKSLMASVGDPALAKRLTEAGFNAFQADGGELQRIMLADKARWERVIRERKISIEV
ncbi:MAG: Bug family tripartite tricarboxylate transporter substrate binding protein [Pigmentiphaga sp.]